MSEKNNEEEKKSENVTSNLDLDIEINDDNIRLIIGEWLLEYKKRLQAKQPNLYSISDSEQHRENISNLYPSITDMRTRLLDSRLLNYILHMQKKRDEYFFQDNSSPQERLAKLSRFMLRLATPVLFLNHNHNLSVNVPEKPEKVQRNLSEVLERDDFVISIEPVLPILTQDELKILKENLKKKLLNRNPWGKQQLNNELSHWEADILSQMLSSGDELIMVITGIEEISFIDKLGSIVSKSKSYVYTLEPES
ncbi:MAG: hypothetical protein ACFFD1_13725 [Candidatus Thorarchaeota archaeon]